MTTTSNSKEYKIDWFTDHIPAWSSVLTNKTWLRAKRPDGIRALMVGVYEGRCLEWLLQNVLTDRATDRATVLDAFDYKPCVSERSVAKWVPGVRETFRSRILGNATYGKQVKLLPPETGIEQVHLQASKASFDIVYIDAHDSVHALESAVHTFPLMRPGGIIIFQNYTHNEEHDTNCPRVGIDAFLSTYVRHIKVVRNGFHLFVQKRTRSQVLPKRECHSEYYDKPEKPLACTEKEYDGKKTTKSSGGCRSR
jgi:hypothetical protein